jgi:hypothetical protein
VALRPGTSQDLCQDVDAGLGGASLKWAKAQQNAPSRPTHWRRKLGPSLTGQIKLGGFGSLSSGISDVSTSVSAAGAAVSLCAAFFNRLGLALATACFAALATLRPLLRLAEIVLRSLARRCSLARLRIFEPFLRLAMLAPFWFPQRMMSDQKRPDQVPATYQTGYHQISA